MWNETKQNKKAPTWNSPSSCSWWVSVPIPISLRFVQNLHSFMRSWCCCCCCFAFLSFSLSTLAHSILLRGHFSSIALPPNFLFHTHTCSHPIFLFCFALSPSAVFCCIELLFGLLLPVLSFCFYKFLVFWSPLEVWFTWGSGVGFDFSFFVFLLILIDYCCHFWKWIVGVCVWVWFGWYEVMRMCCLCQLSSVMFGVFFQMIV